MAQKNISIYITSDVIRMCEVEKSGANIFVNRVFETRTPDDSVEDGLIVDVEKVAVAIQRVLSDNQIKKAKIVFTVFSRKIANKEIELPYVSNTAKIEEMIASNVEDYFPMGNMSEYILRHTILDKVEVEDRKFYKISVVAVQKELVKSYYELGKSLKMPVATVDYQVNSLYNLMRRQAKQGISLILQMDNDVTHVNIMNGATQLFRRSIPFGSDTLIQALATDKGIEVSQAEEMFHDARALDKSLSLSEYTELIKDFSSAITRVVEFYTTKNPELMIEHAKLYGVGAELIGLGSVLGKELGVEIETILNLNCVQIKKKNVYGLLSSQLSAYLPNIGAMMHSLDLRIEDEENRKTGIGYGLFYALIGISAFVSVGLSGFTVFQMIEQQKEVLYLVESIEKLKVAEDIYISYMNAKNYFDVVASFDDLTKNDNEALYSFVLNLEEIMPESVGIVSLNSKDGEISMSGMASGKEPIAMFVMELKKLPYVSNVRVKDIRDTYDEYSSANSVFNIEFQIHMMEEEMEEEPEGGEQ